MQRCEHIDMPRSCQTAHWIFTNWAHSCNQHLEQENSTAFTPETHERPLFQLRSPSRDNHCLVLPGFELYVNAVMQCILFCLWFILLNV